MSGGEPCTISTALAVDQRDPTSSGWEIFSWTHLPQELQVKILEHLRRSDLDKCQLLNRNTFELIRCNKRWMKRRLIDHLMIAKNGYYELMGRGLSLHIQSDEERVFKVWEVWPSYSISCRLEKLLKNADVHYLEIIKVLQSNDLVESILSDLLNADSRIQKLAIMDTSMAGVTSSMLLRFLRHTDPTKIIFSGISDCSRDNFSPEVLQHIVTRQEFFLSTLQSDPIPIDDDILAQLTATHFYIGAPNLLTINGLKSFVERLAAGKRMVTRGTIFTNFFLDGVSFPTSPNIYLELVVEGTGLEISTKVS
ncbi:hypothetical protein GCK32_015092 [Trichostrongylus colubriformis]|uniref:F-box domain-containing protein n=1 Tax=Trichostrongylus colubriformis TaxID=6319 RepID=A0AAN8FNK0_TRICO